MPLTICHCFICGSTEHKINNCCQRQATHEMFKENFQCINKDRGCCCQHALQEIMVFLIKNFGYKNSPYGFFCPHVQLDQNVILDPTILTKYFWLVFLLGLFYQVFLLNRHDNDIIWAMKKKYFI